jgi:monoamine oxidase
MPKYDILIVGAGIAGLNTASELLKADPELKILIVDKYKHAGGRLDTVYLPHGIQYEAGAGRIHSSHKALLKLVKTHNLTLIEIGHSLDWRSSETKITEPDYFFSVFHKYCEILRDLPETILRTKTIRDLMIEIQGVELAKHILDTYPYRAEIEIMSAKASLDLFKSLENGKFFVLKEGFSELTRRIVKNLGSVNLKFNHEIQRLEYNKETKLYTVSGICNKKHVEFKATRIVLAIPKNPLEKLYPFGPDHPLLVNLRMEPLLRIYSIYKNSSWFPENTIVTDSPLRFIIPINKRKGVIMSSYLDARDTEPWLDFTKKENAQLLKSRIHDETQILFPDILLPQAESTTPYLWKDGCTYWLPGDYDYTEISKKALYPMPETYPNLHIVGESFSTKQQWVEGALEHSNELVKLIITNIGT